MASLFFRSVAIARRLPWLISRPSGNEFFGGEAKAGVRVGVINQANHDAMARPIKVQSGKAKHGLPLVVWRRIVWQWIAHHIASAHHRLDHRRVIVRLPKFLFFCLAHLIHPRLRASAYADCKPLIRAGSCLTSIVTPAEVGKKISGINAVHSLISARRFSAIQRETRSWLDRTCRSWRLSLTGLSGIEKIGSLLILIFIVG